MFNIKAAALAAMLVLPMAAALADPSPTTTTKPHGAIHACPTGQHNANDPDVPEQCVKCAAPGCPSCHSERTKETVADTTAAELNCPPPVKPH